jgi:hypothetical protein
LHDDLADSIIFRYLRSLHPGWVAWPACRWGWWAGGCDVRPVWPAACDRQSPPCCSYSHSNSKGCQVDHVRLKGRDSPRPRPIQSDDRRRSAIRRSGRRSAIQKTIGDAESNAGFFSTNSTDQRRSERRPGEQLQRSLEARWCTSEAVT